MKYSVWYKTNTSEEYKIFDENLSTNTNNELDFTTLDLADDEYVTDFEFRFGTYLEKYVEDNDEWTSVVYKKILI